MRHLLLSALALAALFAACYPAEPCAGPCGTSFDGTDCAGFARVVAATVDAFPACDAGSAKDACAALDGYRVHVLSTSETSVDDAGRRYWPAPPNDEGVTRAYGETDCVSHTITLAEEGGPATAWELTNASQGRCPPASYSDWDALGLTCVYQHGRAAPVLTGSNGGT